MAEVNDTQGTKLLRAGVLVPGVFEIGPIGPARALRDVTALDDLIHKHKMNIPDMSEVACKLWYDPEEQIHRAVMSDHVFAVQNAWTIMAEQGNSPEEVWTVTAAYVSSCEIESMAVDGDMVLAFSLKPQAMWVGLFDI